MKTVIFYLQEITDNFLTFTFNNRSIYFKIKNNNTPLILENFKFTILYVCKTETTHTSVTFS